MRTVFNLARCPGFLEVPPWEEWQGVSEICNKESCRCGSLFCRHVHGAASSIPDCMELERKSQGCGTLVLVLADWGVLRLRRVGEVLNKGNLPC